MILAHVGADPRSAHAVAAAIADTEHRLAWAVDSGAEALRRLQRQRVDVLLLSVDVSDVSTGDLTRQILESQTCAVILLADTSGLALSNVYDAMGAGAQDVVPPPAVDARGRVVGAEALLNKLRNAARLLGRPSTQMAAVRAVLPATSAAVPILAIGASTGGPQALLALLSGLPKPFPAAILLVQHVDSEFSQGLATWLGEGSGVSVQLAHSGQVPQAGVAFLASSQDHLVMAPGGALRYRPEPRELPHRPSVDVLFASLAEHCQGPGVAVLLTGMGRDGAEGLAKLRAAGWHTIAQDQATCVVYGMPRAAVELGAACQVLPLPAIAHEVSERVKRARQV